MIFPILSHETRLARLESPKGKVRIVIDTDTFNEIDDQFAIVQALLSPERLQLEALYATPFSNALAATPEEGMEKSYDEILRILERMAASPEDNVSSKHKISTKDFVYRGSRHYLANSETPEDSEAARDLVARAMSSNKQSSEELLYVVAIGAPTNVASALLLEPAIVERIVVVWLGGHALHWHTAQEFNLQQDPTSVRILFASGVPLVLVPCMGVTSHLTTTVAELEHYVSGRGEVGDFLVERFKGHYNNQYGWAKELWDMAPVAYLLNEAWVPSSLQRTTGLNDDLTWRLAEHQHVMRVAHYVNRNLILSDFFRKLEAKFGERKS